MICYRNIFLANIEKKSVGYFRVRISDGLVSLLILNMYRLVFVLLQERDGHTRRVLVIGK